jgi:hypothetical protein
MDTHVHQYFGLDDIHGLNRALLALCGHDPKDARHPRRL